MLEGRATVKPVQEFYDIFSVNSFFLKLLKFQSVFFSAYPLITLSLSLTSL
jgi:hypothetical protein